MNSLKCDTCGAPLELSKDKTHAVCKFCGSTLLFTDTDEGAGPFIENMSKERLLTRGYIELEELNEERADAFFERALNLDPECARAYWGQMLAKKGCISTKDFINQQIQKSRNAQLLSLSPFPDETEAEINKAVAAYTSDGLLKEDDIRSLFVFHEDYLSLLDSREYLYDRMISFFEKDKYVTRALQYADTELREEILSARSQILSSMEEDIESAKQHDKEALERLREPFEAHINDAHKKAAELLKTAKKNQKNTSANHHFKPKALKIEQEKQFPSNRDFSFSNKKPVNLDYLRILIVIILVLLIILAKLKL